MELKNYEQFNSINDKVFIVLAKTKSCTVCNAIEPIVHDALLDYPSIPFYKIFIENVLEFSGQQLVFTVPTLIFYKNNKEYARLSRFILKADLNRILSSL